MLCHPKLVPYLTELCGLGYRLDHQPMVIAQVRVGDRVRVTVNPHRGQVSAVEMSWCPRRPRGGGKGGWMDGWMHSRVGGWKGGRQGGWPCYCVAAMPQHSPQHPPRPLPQERDSEGFSLHGGPVTPDGRFNPTLQYRCEQGQLWTSLLAVSFQLSDHNPGDGGFCVVRTSRRLRPATPDPRPATPDPRRATPHLRPATPDPRPATPRSTGCHSARRSAPPCALHELCTSSALALH